MKKIIAIAMLALVSACGKKSDSSTPDGPPVAAVLSVPASNSTCTAGTVVSATVNTVLFSWNTAANAENYELTVKNLLDNTIKVQTTAATQLTLNLNRNTPYGWWVTSKSGKSTVTAKSDVWKFYNSGVATSSYAPFPADLTSPGYGQAVTAVSGKATLTWNGADVDNDIVAYDVYAGISATGLAIVQADLVPATYALSVASGTTYYWKIVTKDSNGNTSISDINQFKVN